jgi:hypothetical protein
MIVDDQVISSLLHGLDVEPAPDLLARGSRAGRRRVRRTRLLVAATGAAALAVTAAAAITISERQEALSPADRGKAHLNISPLYATPPPASVTHCNLGEGSSAAPAAYPGLLYLPEVADVDAGVTMQEPACRTPHVAGRFVRLQAGKVVQAISVLGPDAAAHQEIVNAGSPDSSSSGLVGHLAVQGNAAYEYTTELDDHTDVYWTDRQDGGWHVDARGMSQQALVDLLNRMTFDDRLGTASLPTDLADAWAPLAAVPDPTTQDYGRFAVTWPVDGGTAEFWVTAQPFAEEDLSFASPWLGSRAVTVNGQPGLLYVGPAQGQASVALVIWQTRDGTTLTLLIPAGTPDQALQVADGVQKVSASDPRIQPR